MSWSKWLEQGEYLAWRGKRVFFRREGSGEALLLIHGFPTSSWDWLPMWDALKLDHDLLAPDLLGFGASSKPHPHRYSISEQANLCQELLGHLRIERAHLLAHDYGDTVAQELLARQIDGQLPFQIRSLVFLNGGLFPECHRPLMLQKLLASPIGPLLVKFIGKAALGRSMGKIFAPCSPPSAEHIDAFWQQLTAKNGRRCMPALLGYIAERSANRSRWVGGMQSSPVPLGFINGSADPISGAHMLARWQQLLPRAAAQELAKVGHYPQIEAPDRVLASYRDIRREFSAA